MNTMQNTKNLFKTKTKINFDLSLNFDNISLQNNNDSLAKN